MEPKANWIPARLIPVTSASGIEAQELRSTSALLSVMSAVDEFGRALLRPLGAPSGKVETFIEVPFKRAGKEVRPDGVIIVRRGKRVWSALVEVKTGNSPLQPNQVNAYLDLARDLDADALLTISNDYVTSSSPYPVDFDRRKTRKVKLAHWSWLRLLTEAILQKEHRGVRDQDQAYILGELIRYLSDRRSGALQFDSMGPAWTKVREAARAGTLTRKDPDAETVAARWDDLVRYVALVLTRDLGRNVKQVLPKRESTPVTRRRALIGSLVDEGVLYADIHVPDSAGNIEICADLRSRRVIATTHIHAPKDRRTKGRVAWLLRQLSEAPSHLRVESRATRSSTRFGESLGAVRTNPGLLYPDTAREITQFTLSLSGEMGLKRSAGRGSFIDSVLDTTRTFYGDALQSLRPWKPAPPRLPKPVTEAAQEPPTKAGSSRTKEEKDSAVKQHARALDGVKQGSEPIAWKPSIEPATVPPLEGLAQGATQESDSVLDDIDEPDKPRYN